MGSSRKHVISKPVKVLVALLVAIALFFAVKSGLLYYKSGKPKYQVGTCLTEGMLTRMVITQITDGNYHYKGVFIIIPFEGKKPIRDFHKDFSDLYKVSCETGEKLND